MKDPEGAAQSIEAESVHVRFGGGWIVRDASLKLSCGELAGLVGRSGAGKSTLAQCLALRFPPSRGTVTVQGRDPWRHDLAALRQRIVYVAQGARAALNPRLEVGKTIAEGVRFRLELTSDEKKERVSEACEWAKVPAGWRLRRASELSGGEQQRVALARAFAARPDFLVLDEPWSRLDLPLRDELEALLHRYLASGCAGRLFVTHDLRRAARLSARLIVMSEGAIVEQGPTREILDNPRQSASQELVEAMTAIS